MSDTVVVLHRLCLRNFKGFAAIDYKFSSLTEIYAENGQGKTTLRDAWFWLLGFNVSDVIPCVDNKEIPNLEIRVEAAVVVALPDGSQPIYRLTRVQKEVRKTNKDTGIEEKVSNESTYFIDDVPFTLKAYKDKIAELFNVPYEKLQMLCVKEYFNSDNGEKWKWTHRRKELFDLCHVDQVLSALTSKECYSLIAPDLAKKLSTTDIKKAVKRELTGYTQEKEKNAVLIADKQNEIAKYGNYNFADLENEKKELESKVTSILMQSAKSQDDNVEKQTIREQKASLETQLSKLRIKLMTSQNELEAKISYVQNEMRKVQTQGENLKSDMETAKQQIRELENANLSLKSAEWQGNTVCPTCHQSIPQNLVETAKNRFKQECLDKQTKNEQLIDEKVEYLNQARKRLQELRETYLTLKSQLDNYQTQLAEYKKPNKEVGDLTKQIADLDTLLKGIESSEPKQTNPNEIVAPLRTRISEITTILGYRKLIADFSCRIESLKAANREITDKEMLAKTKVKQLDEYVKEQVQLVTDVVNSKFSDGVSFSLFSELYAGSEHEIKEECVCMKNGKTYSEMSYGERFLADLIVTESLQNEYGVKLPIFLDNAECYTGEVTKYTTRQLILLNAQRGVYLDGTKIEVFI